MRNNQNITEELLLRAFQYVSGDMTETQIEAFEQQMLADDIVCEAVAEATYLSSLVAACSTQVGVLRVPSAERTDRLSSSNSRSAAAFAVICCSLVLLLALNSLLLNPVSSEAISEATVSGDYSEAEQLVSTWVESSEPNAMADVEPSETFSRELDVPDWMLAAVTLADIETRNESDRSSDGSTPDGIELF